MKQNLKIDPDKNVFCVAGEEEPVTPYEWDDMPEYISKNADAYCVLQVVVPDEESFNEFMGKMDQSYTEKTKSIYYPKQENEELKLFCYTQIKS